MSLAMLNDPAAYARPKAAGGFTQVVAGSGNDNVWQYGPWINVAAEQGSQVIVNYKAVLAATKKLNMQLVMQDAVDAIGTGAADMISKDMGVIATGPAGGGTIHDRLEWGVRVAGSRGWVRLGVKADLEATSVDTVDMSATLNLGVGAGRRNPAV